MTYIHPDDMPEALEIGILNAEEEIRRNRRIRENIRNYRLEDWDRANRENIERGWGPLPF